MLIVLVNDRLEGLDTLRQNAQRSVGLLIGRSRDAEIGTDIEEVLLDALEDRHERWGLGLSGVDSDPERGVGFVNAAVGINPEVVLRDAFSGAQRGVAFVARACVDFREFDHAQRVYPARGGEGG